MEMHENISCESDSRYKVIRAIVLVAVAAIVAIVLVKILPFSPLANKGLALSAFIGILWLTEAIHITATAILVPILAIFIGIPDFDTKKALASFAEPIIFVFFGGFALAAAMNVQQLDKKIAFVVVRLAGGNLGVAVILLFLATAFLSMWINNTATTAMMLPLAIGLLSSLDQKKDRNTFVFVLLGIAYSSSIGGMGTLIGSAPNGIAAREVGVDFIGWFKFGLPMMVLSLPVVIFAMYLILRPKLNYKIDYLNEKINWTPARLLTIIIFFLTVLGWIFGKKIGAYFHIKNTDTVVVLFAVVGLLLFGLVSWKQVSDNTDWGVLMLFGGGIGLSNIMRLSGGSAVLAEQMSYHLSGVSVLVVILVVAAFIIFLTEFTSNTASAALLVPLFAPIGVGLGLPKEVLVMVIGVGASCAFMMPVATPPNAIVMGTGYIKQKDMMKIGLVLNLVTIVVLTVIAYFIW